MSKVDKVAIKPVYRGTKMLLETDTKVCRLAVDEMAARIAKCYNSPEQSDLVFEVADKRLYAHRTYLCMVSEYLRVQLSAHWLKQDTVRIEYYSYDAFRNYLAYLYQTAYEITEENVVELADLAHCYLERGLLEACECFLMRRLTTDSCCELYSMAKRYRLEKLFKSIACHVIQNVSAVALSEGYTKLDPELCKSLWPDSAHTVAKVREQSLKSIGSFVDLISDDF